MTCCWSGVQPCICVVTKLLLTSPTPSDVFMPNFWVFVLTVCIVICSWWQSIVVRTLVSAGELSLSCARLLAGWVTTSRGLSAEIRGRRVLMIFLVYCIVSWFYYLSELSPGPTWCIFLFLWHNIAYLCWKCRKTPSKQTNYQTLNMLLNCLVKYKIIANYAENTIKNFVILS